MQLLGGEAKVACHHVCHLIRSLFHSLHKISYTQLHRVISDLKDDERTVDVMRNIYRLYKNDLVGSMLTPISMKHTEKVLKIVQYFSLCMLKLNHK